MCVTVHGVILSCLTIGETPHEPVVNNSVWGIYLNIESLLYQIIYVVCLKSGSQTFLTSVSFKKKEKYIDGTQTRKLRKREFGRINQYIR